MPTHKQVASSIERQHIRTAKKFYHLVADINLELSKVHRSIERNIDKNNYAPATAYVEQYVSYTTIWNLKFVYNLENPEVALMQILHLIYIFEHEPAEKFTKERRLLAEQHQKFNELKPYKDKQIDARIEKMEQFIVSYNEYEKAKD